METNVQTSGGFIIRKADIFDAKYMCLACNRLLRRPVQLECGHRICFSCMEDIKKKVDEFYCKLCKVSGKLSQTSLDKGFQRDMFVLDISCHQCEWEGKLKNYEDHLEQQHRQVKCEYCNEIFNSQFALQEHEDKSCEKKLLSCPLYDVGCKTKFLRSQRQSHYNSEEHQKIVLVCIEYTLSKIAQNSLASGINENNNMDIDVFHRYDTGSMEVRVPDAVDKSTDQMRHFHETVGILSNGVDRYHKELTDLDSSSLDQFQSIETTEQKLGTIKMSTEESSSALKGMHTNLSIMHEELIALRQKYDDQYVASHNGVLVWKITGVEEKFNSAKSERQVSVYSPPFRSSPTGYKMCARLYLYGDGNARRTHMSLFFVIMRGPHDSLLKFPFSYKVTFCLYDQTNAQRHIVDSFRPDITSNSFQRPSSNMNIASGIPRFAPLSVINVPNTPYIKDDTMFIKILVDFENVSRTMLPFVIKLNPGLPIHAQQKIIWEETMRREQQLKPTT